MFILCLCAALLIICLIISYICFRMAFYAPDKSFKIPTADDTIYKSCKDQVNLWKQETQALNYEQFKIKSFDGLDLYGKYYEFAPGAPIEIMFHGYRGSAERDLAGGVPRCFKLGRSALLVDQRCSGKSGGRVISFGINEHKDCLAWVDFACKHFGSDIKLILTGISMGASTVLMVADKELPDNVIGILSDCGFSSAEDIMKDVIKDMKLPPNLGYSFVKLGAKLFGHFDLEETSPLKALKNSRVPVIFFHGEVDDFVHPGHSFKNFEACSSERKKLVTIPGADHGLSFPIAPQKYLDELYDFFGPEASLLGSGRPQA